MICHSIFPKVDGKWLAPWNVASILQSHFSFVTTDTEEGASQARKVLQRMREIDAPRDLIEQLDRTYSDSLAIAVSDDPSGDGGISLLVMPEDPIKIYHEVESLPLVKKIQAALGYDIMEL